LAESLGAAVAELEEAVEAVGPSVPAVEQYLAEHKARPSDPPHPTPEPFRGYVLDEEEETIDLRRRPS